MFSSSTFYRNAEIFGHVSGEPHWEASRNHYFDMSLLSLLCANINISMTVLPSYLHELTSDGLLMLHVLIFLGSFIFSIWLSRAVGKPEKQTSMSLLQGNSTNHQVIADMPLFIPWRHTGLWSPQVQTTINWPQLFFTASTPAAICYWWPAPFTSQFFTDHISHMHFFFFCFCNCTQLLKLIIALVKYF